MITVGQEKNEEKKKSFCSHLKKYENLDNMVIFWSILMKQKPKARKMSSLQS